MNINFYVNTKIQSKKKKVSTAILYKQKMFMQKETFFVVTKECENYLKTTAETSPEQ